jgi:hypothetical protein
MFHWQLRIEHLLTSWQYKNENGIPIVPIGLPVGDYNGLNWGPFTLQTSELAPLGNIGGVIPSTQPKSAAFAGITQQLTGSSSITVDPKSKWSYFGLHGFHFGCTVISGTSAFGLNTACSVIVTGSLGGAPVPGAATTVTFDPENHFAANMSHALLPEAFAHVDKVSFALASSVVTVSGAVLLIDNVYYTTYY